MKHQPQVSPGSKDFMMGCLVLWKCFVACLFLELSQQPTWPHSRHNRRCTQGSPIFKHSSQPCGVFGFTGLIWLRWVHAAILFSWLEIKPHRGHSPVPRGDSTPAKLASLRFVPT